VAHADRGGAARIGEQPLPLVVDLELRFGGASISGLKYSAARLVAGITRSLFVEDSAAHFESLCSFAETEF
jgi:hypothetical protein